MACAHSAPAARNAKVTDITQVEIDAGDIARL
jgi:hypothetical protein